MSKLPRSISRLEQFVSNEFDVNLTKSGRTYRLMIISKTDSRNQCIVHKHDLQEAIDYMYERFYLNSLLMRQGKPDNES